MRKRKDYSELINKQFGELTILSISEPVKEMKSQRYCACKCSCGKEIEVQLHHVLAGQTASCGHNRTKNRVKSRNQNPNCSTDNKSTGIKNISFHKHKKCYRVVIERNYVRHEEYASSLAEAIKIKERILQDLGELD
jgi:hypothetical protein